MITIKRMKENKAYAPVNGMWYIVKTASEGYQTTPLNFYLWPDLKWHELTKSPMNDKFEGYYKTRADAQAMLESYMLQVERAIL